MHGLVRTMACLSLLLAAQGCDEKQKPDPKPVPDSGQPGKGLPAGAIILMASNCPQGFTDLTGQFNGRLVGVDTNAVDAAVLTEGDGTHTHGGGAHQHTLSGNVNDPGEGYREGGGGRRSAGIRAPIVGTAQPSEHTHDGGAHKHASVGLRLCQAG